MIRRAGLILLVLLGLSAAAAAAARPLLTAAGRFLIVQDAIERADVIVVLAGGRGDERVRQAAQLYREGFAPTVLLSGGETMAGISIPEVQRRQALAYGIPARALVIEGDSTSTREQAERVRPMLEARGIRRAIVVTSSFHTRRTRYVFRKVFRGSGIDVRVYPVQDDRFSPEAWWTRDQDTEDLVLEYIKLGLALLR